MKKRFLLTWFVLAFAVFAKAQTHWTAPSTMAYNMTGNAVVFVNGSSIMGSEGIANLELGVFKGDECRGCALPIVNTFPMTQGTYPYVYNMMLYSNSLTETGLTFRLYNHQTNEEECLNSSTTITFQSDGTIGNLVNPLQVQLVDAVCFYVTAEANPTAGGTVTGGGHIREGNSCTLTATAVGCYQFLNWTNGSEVVSTNASYTFTPTEDIAFVANFQANTFSITASVDPSESGTITGAGTYDCGATCTLNATPVVGYQFVNWTKGGVEVSTNAEYSFTVEEEGAYVAHFSMEPYVITATANPTEGGTVAVDGTLVHGTTCTLTATPAEHYVFVNWTLGGEVVSTNAAYSFTVTGDGAYVANFELASYEITATVNPAGAGTVTGAGTITYGQTCTLTATANGGYTFTNWTKGGVEVSTNATYSFTVEEAGAYVANFAPKTYTVTASANPTDGGIVTLSPEATSGSYSYGQQVRLRAIAKLGYNFVNWTKGGVAVSTESTFNITIGDDTEGAYVANFSMVDPLPAVPTETHWTFNENTQYSMIITGVMVLDGASVPNTIAPYLEIGAFVGDVCKGSFLAEYVNIPPLNVDGYFYQMTLHSDVASGEQLVFRVWDHINNVELDVTSLSNTNFVADANLGDLMNPHVLEFETNLTIHYNITATANPADGGTVTGSGSYEEETQCTLVATADSHYDFTNWTLNGQVVSSNPTYAFTATADGSYVANFTPKSYSVTVTTPVHGSVEGAGTYVYNTQCVLVATPDEGYHFVNWTKAGTVVSEELSYGFAVDGDSEFVATFAINTYDIVATPSPDATVAAGGGTVTGAGTYEHFATCTLIAIPANNRWVFENWTENDVVIEGATDTLSFEVTGPRNLVANFAPIYTINATVDADIAVDNVVPGTIEGTGDIIKGRTWTLTETPDAGYTFVNWFEVINEERVFYSNETSISEEAQADRTFVAYYTLNSYDITTTVAPDAVPATATEITVAGTVTGDDTYHHYDTCTLVATPSTGYHFVNWTENDVEVSTSATYAFTVVGGRALVANFELDTHEITVTVSPAEVPATATEITAAGSIEGTGTYNYYDMCTLTATPSTGYHFVNWTENGTEVATTAIYELMVEGDRALVANFELDTHTITLNVADVTVDVPAAAPAVPGTVTGDGTYNYYAMCTLVATSATGYHFVNWTESGQEVSTSATYEFMITEDRALVANFELDTHVITLSVADVTENTPAAAPAVPGTVTGDGTYNYYATCTLVATPATGYHFVNWTVNGTEVSTSATYEFMVEGDRALVANFELDTHTITVNVADVTDNTPAAAPAVPGTVTGDGTYNYYATCTLVATPATGYHFVNWTENGTEVSASTTYEFMVAEDRALVANFELDTHVITLSVADVTENIPAAAPSVPGTVTGDGTYNYYATCTLVAIPATGYHFVNWTVNGTEVSASATYEFMAEGDRALVANFELDSYTIATSIVPAETPDNDPDPAGVVTSSGTYTHYSTCELTATANTGYTFVNWTLNGVVVSTDATYSFMVTGPGTYVANFEINTYTITATDNPSGYGTITGAGTYEHFSTCTLTATAGEGHTFFNWSENDVEVSTSANYSFTVTGPRTLVAHFINRYAITVTANPTVGGTVTGAGVYDEGSTVTLTATPATGYHFVNWSLNGTPVSTDATYSFNAMAAGNYIANFAINNYAITAEANPSAGGTVTGTGNYDHFTTCTLTATANTGYTFVNWTKNGTVVSTNTTYSFTVESEGDYVANFQLNSYAITATLDPTDAGTVTGAGSYNHFETCTLTANPSSSYLFVNWTKNGTVVSTNPSISFEVTGPAAYVAHFIPNTYEITATAVPSYAGTVTGAGTYYYNTTCTLTATPNTGHHFLNWTKNGAVVSTDASISFTVTANEEYVAHFDANVYQVTLFTYPSVGGTVTGGGAYPYGQTCVIEAVANEGYSFVEWKLNDDEVISTTPTYMFNVTENVAFVAYFALNTYEITATANPADGGTVTGAGTYNYGESCTLTAAAAEGYTFVNWTLDGVVVSTSANYTFTVTESNDYVANFSLNSYEITATANPTEGGTVTGAGNYNYGASCTLTATPTTGYNFVNWTKNGTVVSTEASYSFTVTGAGAYVANFEIITFVITATVAPDGAGEVEGAGTYNYGATVTMTATAAEGYRFVNWTEGDEVVSVEETFTFTALSDRQLVAHFQSTVGVGETEWPEVSVYPNPATDKLYIETHRQSSRCEIYTITGALVYMQEDCAEQFVIEVSDFTVGAYIVRIISDSMVQNIRFIKQ